MERISNAEFFRSGNEVESAVLHPQVSKVDRLKSDVQGQLHRAHSELHRDPMKWAAIAAAAGLGLGFIGRYLRYRAKVRKRPQLYVIEGC
jgi:hypothetical protein